MSDTSLQNPHIVSSKVQGTPVFSLNTLEGLPVEGSEPRHIGAVEYLLIDKLEGRVVYLVISFGGFLGLGQGHYRLPWESVSFYPDLGGYVTGVTVDQMRAAPHHWDDS